MSNTKATFVIAPFVLLLSLSYYLFLNNNQNEKELNELLFYKFTDSLSHSIEGLDIWDISTITKEKFNNSISKNKINSEYILFIAIDSINCMTCYNFHSEHWVEIVNKIPMLVYTKNLFKFVKQEYIQAEVFEIKAKDQIQISSKSINFLSLLINRQGKILYSDISELKNFKRSEMFYENVTRQIK